MRTSLISLFFMLVTTVAARAIPESPESYGLEDCIRIGTERSEEVRIHNRLVENAERERITAWTALLPSMEYTLTRGFTQGNPVQLSLGSTFGSPTTSQVNNYLTSSLTITEILYDNQVTLNNTVRTSHALEKARFIARNQKNKLILEITKAYYQLASNYHLDLISQEELLVAKKQEELAQIAFEVGSKPKSDVLKAKVALRAKEAKQYKVRAEFASAKAALFNRLVLEPEAIEVDLSKNADPTPFRFPDIPNEAEPIQSCDPIKAELETAQSMRPDLLSLGADVNVADVDLNDTWRKFLPRLDVRGSYSWTNPRAGDDFLRDYSTQAQATINLTWTLWDWGANWRNISSKRVLRDNLEDRQFMLRRQVALELQTACLELRAKHGEFAAHLLRVSLSKENLEKAGGTYRAGKDTIEGVFRAREEYIQSLQDRVSSYYALRIAEAQREQANGTIDQRLRHQSN